MKVHGSTAHQLRQRAEQLGLVGGGMISSAGDLVTFLTAMLEGRLFSDDALTKATDWRAIEPGDIVSGGEYGMGLFRRGSTPPTIGARRRPTRQQLRHALGP